jgi:hypothetical protein
MSDPYADGVRCMAVAVRALTSGITDEDVRTAREGLMLTTERYGRRLAVAYSPLLGAVAHSRQDAGLATDLVDLIGREDLHAEPLMVRAFGGWVRGRLARLVGEGSGVPDVRRAISDLEAYGALAYAALARLDLAERIDGGTEATALRNEAISTLERVGAYGWIPANRAGLL